MSPVTRLAAFRCSADRRHESPFSRKVTERVFGSTGQRNTLVEYFCWGTEGQRLARPLVQLTSGPVQVGLRARREVCAFREVLAEETIRVLVRPPLPRALRIAEVDPHVGEEPKEHAPRRHPFVAEQQRLAQ